MPSILPQLIANIAANAAVRPCDPSVIPHPVLTWPLSWGDPASAGAVLSQFTTQFGETGTPPRPRCDVILAADVVYHEALIGPLLTTLAALTPPLTGLCSAHTHAAPLVLVSYVQRFKRAREFLKHARKLWDVAVLPVGHVVDYDALNWNRGTPLLCVDSGSADVRGFVCGPTDAGIPVTCLAYHYLLRRHVKPDVTVRV